MFKLSTLSAALLGLLVYYSCTADAFSIKPSRQLSLKTAIGKLSSLQRTRTQPLMMSVTTPWKSVVSSNPDLNAAVNEILTAAQSKHGDDCQKYTVAVLFTSSIYEATAFKYDDLLEKMKQKMPSLKTLIGCTTGGIVGPSEPWGEPAEVEARASIGVMFAAIEGDVETSTFYLSQDEIRDYIKDKDGKSSKPIVGASSASAADAGSVVLLFATEQAKPNLGQFVTSFGERENVEVLGAVASSVTSLHIPRVFLATSSTSGSSVAVEKYSSGVAGLVLKGNVCVQTVVARSCLPVGPTFTVNGVAGPGNREILSMTRDDGEGGSANGVTKSPLEHLDDVLNEISADQSYMLKRELLVGLVPEAPKDLMAKGSANIMASSKFFGQKPIAFDPLSGSVTVPSMPGVGSSFQFIIRDATSARQDLQLAADKLESVLSSAASAGSDPLAMFMIGSMERGNKVFRFQSYEALQLYSKLQQANIADKVPISGLYSYGAFSRVGKDMSKSQCALMEADSLYAVITKKATSAGGGKQPQTKAGSVSTSSSSQSYLFPSEDICTPLEAAQFNDEADGVIVTKRDPDSAHAVKVASMDYVVPEKAPQPKNVLESLVWDREKDVDRMRETTAKMSDVKFPRRSLIEAVRKAASKTSLLNSGGGAIPPMVVEVVKASLHNGKLEDESQSQLAALAAEAAAAGAIAVGTNADTGTFRGQFEDLEVVRSAVQTPVICNDFVVYGYQIFRAKACGADVIRLMASVLPVQDIEYMIKTAKALGMMCMVVVSSKQQLLDVLKGVPTLQALSVTSRNMRLWKIDANKASRILTDPEVVSAIAAKRAAAAAAGPDGDFILLQEAFTTHDELVEAHKNGVDAIILGEELLQGKNMGLTATIEKWNHH